MTAENARRFPGTPLLLLCAAVVLGLGWWWLATGTRDALVVYCAHDLMFAEEVLHDFERDTGIRVIIVGDTEATKSLGLVQRLIREKEQPVCDVFWNNQLLGTVELARQGVLEPYRGAHWETIPERYKDDEGLWTGFGGRMRVWIINTDAPPAMSQDLDNLADAEQLQSLAIAEPMFGTTLSHYAVLWHQMGAESLQQWHQRLVDGGARFVAGNATVKDLVAGGVCAIGMTDTDDYFLAVDADQPVTMQPTRVPSGETICIPNTVAIIRGTEKRSQAERLVDYLTSSESELRMAGSKSRQIPLGMNVSRDEVPEDVQLLMDWAAESVDLKPLADARSACLKWLTGEFAP
jgi:iron(III) transport system substrate-binding protein